MKTNIFVPGQNWDKSVSPGKRSEEALVPGQQIFCPEPKFLFWDQKFLSPSIFRFSVKNDQTRVRAFCVKVTCARTGPV